MTTTIPDLTDAQLNELPSHAEARVYRSLRDNLPDDYVVLFQVGWILRQEGERARDGETDFLICHPDKGCLCVEVKGGGVGFDAATGEWSSIDRHGRKHKIKNPIDQALKAKYSVRSKLDEHPRWRAFSLGNVLLGHAVLFPGHRRRHCAEQGGSAGRTGWHGHGSPGFPELDRFGLPYWGSNVRNVVALGRRGLRA